MVISKYEKYVKGLGKCIKSVEKAIDGGALLTDMELTDYYFKRLLGGESISKLKLLKDRTYRIACFYAWGIDSVESFRRDGYENADVDRFSKQLCKNAFLAGLTGKLYKTETYDKNGTLYFNLDMGKTYEQFEITCLRDFVVCMLAVMSFLASRCIKDKEYKEFVERYAIGVYNDIRDVVEPTPYIYVGEAKTLSRYIHRDTVTVCKTENEKILQFRVG